MRHTHTGFDFAPVSRRSSDARFRMPGWLRSAAVHAIGILATLTLMLGLAGCLSRPALTRQSFGFALPPSTNSAARSGRVLGIRRIEVAPPFDGQTLVYRTGEFSYERDPYAEFLVPPAQDLEEPLRAWFRATGAFKAVAEPGSALKPDTLVEVFLDQLYGDFRHPAHGEAVLSARFVIFDAPQGAPAKVLLQKQYSLRLPLHARTAAAVVAGWNEELGRIAARVCSDLQNQKLWSQTRGAPVLAGQGQGEP